MKVFLGSSTESLPVLREIASWIEEAQHEPLTWDVPTLFLPGDNTFSKLIEISKKVDAAVLVFGEDDHVWYRTDGAMQPRDNVLIEYGLFAGALGQSRVAICKDGSPREPSDLRGVTTVDVSQGKRNAARMKLLAWLQSMQAQKEDPLSLELILVKRQRDEANERLAFESQKAKDLQELLGSAGVTDFSRIDLSADGHWKLLFDYDYYWKVADIFAEQFSSPASWLSFLTRIGLESLVSRIDFSQVTNKGRTGFYVRKTLRMFRRFYGQKDYALLIDRLNPVYRAKVDEVGRVRGEAIASSP